MLYLKFLKRLQQILRTHAHLYTHTNICFMRCTIFSSRFVREGGWVGITLKCEYKKGGMQRAVSFQAHISKSFSPWNDVWWVCIIIYICFMLHFSCFSTLYIVYGIVSSVAHPHIVVNILFLTTKRFCIYDGMFMVVVERVVSL